MPKGNLSGCLPLLRVVQVCLLLPSHRDIMSSVPAQDQQARVVRNRVERSELMCSCSSISTAVICSSRLTFSNSEKASLQSTTIRRVFCTWSTAECCDHCP